ncbi:hypothetical protein J2W97_003770 [Paenibacillus jamilae]|jgi:hypothetical protein|uniref:hypothetical protein n=1 Tax=Paenibacillus TaxID=44249 RepID=UPI000D30202B|nr:MULTISPECIES: hypothetical protein [Paenibacillus]MDP9677760.1 hypothetical protein [Paenibacillus jamilae]KAF6621540.1 hypothetical protein HFE00_02570 [Paenibacillus sp. EKM101P]KAF6622845.1 hypothetical protein HFE03_12035 [Paenibacillus sp. EKM102P]KAF6632698.1 hypothetical protein HFE01_12075 [Paenibacillus sp. EKM10P]KAF6647449.1 hypothetical protein HFE02_14130 [Paenibacillus sp. EKM11P]
MAQSKEMRARAKKFQGRPVCVTLHSGETYVGYITDVNRGGLILASAGAPPRASSGKQDSRSLKRRASSHAPGVRLGNRKSGTRKPSSRSRFRKQDAKVSAFLPMMGSLLGGLGGSTAGAGGLGGMLGGGLRLFGMIQKFVPVVKMGYGMIKSIRPFLGAVKGLMPSASPTTPNNE